MIKMYLLPLACVMRYRPATSDPFMFLSSLVAITLNTILSIGLFAGLGSVVPGMFFAEVDRIEISMGIILSAETCFSGN